MAGSVEARRQPVEVRIPSGQNWIFTRTLLLLFPAGLLLAAAADYVGFVRNGAAEPFWVPLLVIALVPALTIPFAWIQRWEVPVAIQLSANGMTVRYRNPRQVELAGQWSSWTPKTGSPWLGTVSFAYEDTYPYLLVTIPQARAILRSEWAPRWELPESVLRVSGR